MFASSFSICLLLIFVNDLCIEGRGMRDECLINE